MVCLVIVVLLAGAAGVTVGVAGLSGHRPSRQGPRGLPSPGNEGTSETLAVVHLRVSQHVLSAPGKSEVLSGKECVP